MADIKKPNVVTNLRELINRRQTKVVPFAGTRIEINKLTLAECTEIQKQAKDLTPENPEKGFELLQNVIRMGVPSAADFTDDDFQNFPMDDLNKLSDAVLAYAGMDPKAR
jgi:hypothetical protein